METNSTGTLRLNRCISPLNKYHQRRHRLNHHRFTYADGLESTDGDTEEDCTQLDGWYGHNVRFPFEGDFCNITLTVNSSEFV